MSTHPLAEVAVPPLVKTVMLEAAKTRFRAFNITLPTSVRQPGQGGGGLGLAGRGIQIGAQRLGAAAATAAAPGLSSSPLSGLAGTAGSGGTTSTSTPLPFPPALVRAASNDSRDVDEQKRVNAEVGTYLDGIFGAIVEAHNFWRQSAGLRGVQINGPTAVGGFVEGPLLASTIAAHAPSAGWFGGAAAASRAIGGGISRVWQDWQQTVHVPGLPWYPAFVAFPGPMAPPMPNVPSPFASLAYGGAIMNEALLVATMRSHLAGPLTWPDELFAAVAAGLVAGVALWMPQQQVMLVLGRGPIPTFAPPYVPVGPVVGGDILPGQHFVS